MMVIHKPYLFCILLGLACMLISSYSSGFGVLMTTPEQRLEIDQRRNGFIRPSTKGVVSIRSSKAKVLALNGLVTRKNGPNAIWVNGALIETPDVLGVSINAGKLVNKSVVVKLPRRRPTVLLKPGQQLGLTAGKVIESYNIRNKALSKSHEKKIDKMVGDLELEFSSDPISGME